jgi:hypothetical protein
LTGTWKHGPGGESRAGMARPARRRMACEGTRRLAGWPAMHGGLFDLKDRESATGIAAWLLGDGT